MEQVTITPETPKDPAVEAEEEKLLAGKYKTAEELEKGYNELVQKLGASPVVAEVTEETPVVAEVTEEEAESASEKAAEAAEAAGVDIDALTTEYTENDGLTDATYEALAAKGIPRELVDKHIELLQGEADAFKATMFDSVGGEDSYMAMIDWAGKTLDAEAIEAFDTTLNSSKAAAKVAVQGLFAQYNEATGSDPQNLVQGKPSASSDVFGSWAQVTAAMADPRYAKDSEFRKQVQDKLGRSSV